MTASAPAHKSDDTARLASRAAYGKSDLARLIKPRSIAVVGASSTRGSFGYNSVENAALGGRGNVYPVNPKYDEILGYRCYPDIKSLPEVPDSVVLTLPRKQVLPVAEECAALGVGGLVIFSSGYAESGTPEGIAEQRRLTEIGRRSGMRIVGPNCVGVMNFIDRCGLSFQPGLSSLPAHRGPVGLVVQSGAMGFVITQAMHRGIGFSYTFAPGNSCDVDICDLINFLAEDEHTKAIGCVFEGTHDGARLMESARKALTAGKPVVMLKLGTNEQSGQATMSHTGTIAGSNAAYRAAVDATGIIAVDDFEAVLETTVFMSAQRKPRVPGVGVMSASGGAAVLAADKAAEAGIELPPLAPETAAKVRERIPDFGSTANPCDITAASLHDKTMYGHCIQAFAEDPSFGAVVVPMMTANPPSTVDRAAYICGMAGQLPVPLCIVWLNEWVQGPGSEVYDSCRDLTVFRSMGRCMRALKLWQGYYANRDRLLAPPSPRITEKSAHAAAMATLKALRPGQSLTERRSKQLLAAYGVRVTREELAATADAAVKIADRIGYPIALKAESEMIPHKTEAGVIRLWLKGPEDVRRAYGEIMEATKRLPATTKIDGFLVQEMVAAGTEILLGTRFDPVFGAVVTCALGGVHVEILKDSVSALAPIGREQAHRMLASLKAYRLLTGYRGSKAVDIDALADTLCRVSELAADAGPLIAEMDINPVIAGEKSAIAVDALVVAASDHG